MDPLTIGLLLASIGSSVYGSQSAKGTAAESLDFQKQRAAEQDRMARAARTDAYGNVVEYDPTTNQWVTRLTPGQKALMYAGESEQRRQLTEDAARNRAARERQARAGRMAMPGFDEALARYRFDQPESEASIRARLAELIGAAKTPGEGPEPIRTAGNVRGQYTPNQPPESGTAQLAKTLMQARSQGLSEFGARGGVNEKRYGSALDRYANLLGGGGGAPISMPSTAKDLEGQQQDMARLIASVGASGSQAIGGAQAGALKASMMPLINAKELAQIARYGAAGKGKTAGGTTGTSGARASNTGYDPFTDPDIPLPTPDPRGRYAGTTFPVESTYGYGGGYDPSDLYKGWYVGGFGE
jgi:hypothetical protein